MDHSLISQFLNSKPSIIKDDEIGPIIIYDYKGRLLNYQIWVTPDENQISISASPGMPFGGDSFYEFYVRCDSIRVFQNPYGIKNQISLAFGEGDVKEPKDIRMTVHMREDGDLVVWPRSFH